MHPLVRQVRMYAVEVGKKHPQHGRAIDDVLRIMDEEIARGSPIQHEIAMAYGDLDYLMALRVV